MRVVFHAVAARKGKEGGATKLIREVSRALARVAPEHDYVFLMDASVEVELGEGVDWENFSFKSAAERLYWDQSGFPRVLRALDADVAVAFLGFGAYRPGVPQVAFLPDATYFSRFSGFGRTLPERALIALKREALRATVASSSSVVVPSLSMREAVGSRFSTALRKLHLIRYGYDGGFEEPDPKPWNEQIRLLYVSQLQPHKAHIHLLDIARSLEDRDLDFKITIAVNREDNPRLWSELFGQIEARRLSDRFRVESNLGGREIIDLYRSADCFLYPSVCESFGFPMLEAVAAGLPVVAASTPINREVLGPGALYYSPMDPSEAGALVESLADSSFNRAEMVLRAQSHLRRILPTWDEHALYLERILKDASRS